MPGSSLLSGEKCPETGLLFGWTLKMHLEEGLAQATAGVSATRERLQSSGRLGPATSLCLLSIFFFISILLLTSRGRKRERKD